MRRADLAVDRRREVRWEKCDDEDKEAFGGKRGVGTPVEKEVVEWIEEADAECACLAVSPFPFCWLPFCWFPRLETELLAEAVLGSCEVKIKGEEAFVVSSCPTHQSQRSHPRNVKRLPHPTTATGETRSWKMPTKQTMKIMTEQTCWTMTVESATRGQKS